MLKKIFKKEDLAKNLSIKTGLSNNFSKKIINDLISIISKNIKLGKFNLKNVFQIIAQMTILRIFIKNLISI